MLIEETRAEDQKLNWHERKTDKRITKIFKALQDDKSSSSAYLLSRGNLTINVGAPNTLFQHFAFVCKSVFGLTEDRVNENKTWQEYQKKCSERGYIVKVDKATSSDLNQRSRSIIAAAATGASLVPLSMMAMETYNAYSAAMAAPNDFSAAGWAFLCTVGSVVSAILPFCGYSAMSKSKSSCAQIHLTAMKKDQEEQAAPSIAGFIEHKEEGAVKVKVAPKYEWGNQHATGERVIMTPEARYRESHTASLSVNQTVPTKDWSEFDERYLQYRESLKSSSGALPKPIAPMNV